MTCCLEESKVTWNLISLPIVTMWLLDSIMNEFYYEAWFIIFEDVVQGKILFSFQWIFQSIQDQISKSKSHEINREKSINKKILLENAWISFLQLQNLTFVSLNPKFKMTIPAANRKNTRKTGSLFTFILHLLETYFHKK